MDSEERRKVEQEFGKLLDVFPQRMSIWAADGQRLYANDTLLEFLGITQQEFLADDYRKRVFHPDDLGRVEATLAQAISRGERWEMEARVRGKDGKYRWVLIRVRPVRDEKGIITRWYGAGADIEDRKTAKRAEMALHLSNDALTVYKQLVESSMDGILAFDKEGRYTIWNGGMEKIFGFRDEERLGKHASELCPFFKLVDGTNCYSAALSGNGIIASDVPYVFPDSGIEIFLEGRFSPLRNCDGDVIGGLATIRDVTESKKSADALRRSEAYLAEAQALSHTGSYAYSVAGQILYLSEEAHRTFGFDPGRGTVTYEQVQSRVHPEDVHIFEACSREVIREKKGASSDFRLLLPSVSEAIGLSRSMCA